MHKHTLGLAALLATTFLTPAEPSAFPRDEFGGECRLAGTCFANYEAPVLQATVATTYKTAGALWSVGSRRIQVYELEFGQTGGLSSTDCQCQWDVSLFSSTNILTASAVVPNKLDPADATALAIFANNATTELTYTTAGNGLSLKNWGINQRGSYRWRCLDDGDNIVIPATNLTGIGVRTLSSNFTGSAIGNISFLER
jgi:hypothetical protein